MNISVPLRKLYHKSGITWYYMILHFIVKFTEYLQICGIAITGQNKKQSAIFYHTLQSIYSFVIGNYNLLKFS